MTYKNIYIEPSSDLANARASAGSRSITVLACQKLICGDLDKSIGEVIEGFRLQGWPSRGSAGTKRLAVWVRPDGLTHLAELAKTHNVSTLRVITAWMESAAKHHLSASSAQAGVGESAQPTKASAPIIATHQAATELLPIAQPNTSRMVDGREQRLFECNRHRLMSHDQISQVFQNGGLWLDHKIHAQAMANAWTLDQLLEHMAQNPGMPSNIIQIARTPAPVAATPIAAAQPIVYQQPQTTEATSEPDYAAAFIAAGMAMFDPNRMAA